MTPGSDQALLSFLASAPLCPSFEEIRVAMGWGGKARVWEALERLEREGRIVRLRHKARAIQVVDRAFWWRWDDEEKRLVPREALACTA